MTNEEYFANSAISNSDLGLIKQSIPKFLYEKSLEEKKETVALIFGAGLHCLILEQEEFDKKYFVIKETINKRTNIGKARYAEIIKENYGKLELSADNYNKLIAMREKLRKHPIANELVKQNGRMEFEKPLFFEYLDIKCRAKPDIVDHLNRRIIEIKTIAEANNIEIVKRAIIKYGYYRAASFYQIAVMSITKQFYNHIFIFLEKSEPFGIRIVELGIKDKDEYDWLNYSIDEINELINKYKAYKAEPDKWWGYPLVKEIIEIPDYLI